MIGIHCNGILHASLHGFCIICAERGKQNFDLLMLTGVIQNNDKSKKCTAAGEQMFPPSVIPDR